MKKDEIVVLINEILNNEISIEIRELKINNTLLDLGLDSISFMMLIVHIEERLSIEIDLTEELSEEYSELTIEVLVNEVYCKLKQKRNTEE